MTLLILAYLAGVLTIATPCILPILPFVLARADQPFRRAGLPLLLGLAASFAGVAILASVAGNWAVEANQYGRLVALALMGLFGLTLLSSRFAVGLTRPMVAAGNRLSDWAGRRTSTIITSLVLGIATGLLWAPCAGPVLGLILTGAALEGPGGETICCCSPMAWVPRHRWRPACCWAAGYWRFFIARRSSAMDSGTRLALLSLPA